MARKKDSGDDLAGTVEGLARDHWEREKAAYEERTGEKVKYVPSVPMTRTPLDLVTSEEPVAETVADAAEGEGA